VQVKGRDFIVYVHDLAAVPMRQLGPAIGDLRYHTDDPMRALDILMRGF